MANVGSQVFFFFQEKGYQKKFGPILLLIVYKDLKKNLHNAVLLFNLAMSLRLEGSQKFSLDPWEIV